MKTMVVTGAAPAAVTDSFTIGILAGGESSRMGPGRDKALMKIGGRPAVLRLCEMLGSQCDRVIISAKAENSGCFPGMDVVVDSEPGKGPLMGVVSVLTASTSELTGIVPCDIPSIDPSLFHLLCSQIGDAEIAVPTFDGMHPEPMLAVYRRSVVARAQRSLAQGDYRVANLFRKCRTVIVTVPHADWYSNINTPEEYERFCATLDEKEKRT